MEDDNLRCCAMCCFLCCICGAKATCNLYTFLAALALAAVLVAAFAFALPVRATVTDASLARLDLITGGGTRNGGATAASLAYNLSLTVVLRNPNWAMRAELAAPLDAELRFAGRRFDGDRLAEAGRRIPPRKSEEFRVLAVSSPRGVALGSGGAAAAEFAKERASGVFELELKLSGVVRYRPVHLGRSRRLEATCPVKMLMAPAPATTATLGTHLMVLDKVISCY
uniref:Late embryogenesis abundant protein LEA-2 subgroup domain-containing protein n=1 Tax=Setaria viridis TaxID=4556 RepID=A0A4U6UED3_SETVI|nr:hypothetical protein SEVIR_5G112700v2 [Setaria viridis]